MARSESIPLAKAVPFSICRFIAACTSGWRVLAIVFCSLLVLSGAYLYVRKPMAEIYAQLMLPPQMGKSNIFALSDIMSSFSLSDVFGTSSTINEVEVLRSHDVFLNTVTQLGLNQTCLLHKGVMKWMPSYREAPLVLDAAASIPDTLSVSIRWDIEPASVGKYDIKARVKRKVIAEARDVTLPAAIATPYGEFTLRATGHMGREESDKYRILYSSYNAAAQDWAQEVDIFEPNKKADFIALGVKVTDAEFGKSLLSAIIRNYNNVGMNQIDAHNNRTLLFIDSRLDSLRQSMVEWETKMSKFKTDNKLTNIELDAQFLIEQTSQVEQLSIAAQIEDKILEQTYQFLSNPENAGQMIPTIISGGGNEGNNPSVPSTLGSSDISMYNQLVLERMRLTTAAKADHQRIRLLDKQIEEARQAVLGTLANARESSKIKLGELDALKSKAYGRISDIPRLETEYVNLYLQVKMQQELYLFMMKQREEANMSLAAVSPTLDVLDQPYEVLPPPGLSAVMVLALAVFFGLLIAVFYVYYVELPKQPVMSAEALSELAEMPVLGSNSDIELLRSNIAFALQTDTKDEVVVTSVDGESHTDLAARLTESFARVEDSLGIVSPEIKPMPMIGGDPCAMDYARRAYMTLIAVDCRRLTPAKIEELNRYCSAGRLPRMALAIVD